MALDFLVKAVGARNEDAREEHKAITITFNWDTEPVKLAKPITYMNLSGDSVQALAHYYKIPLDHILVVHDEMDLPFGEIRFKTKGGDGSHNGLTSLLEKLGTGDFLRLRIGIGRNYPEGSDPAKWLLRNFSKEEQAQLPEIFNNVVDAIESVVFDGPVVAMNKFNKKGGPA